MSVSVMSWVWDESRSEGAARLVLLAIADCACHDGSHAWPSNAELQRKCALSERGVRAAVRKLVEIGELQVTYNAGPGGCNRYTVLMNRGGTECPGGQEMPRSGARRAPGTVLEPSEEQPPLTPPRGGEAAEPLEAFFTADFEQGYVETVRTPRKPEPGSDDDPGFAAFWQAYPRHVAKQTARRAYRSAVRGGAVPGEIIAGAEQYRDDYRRRARGIDYTAHPATWLNGKRWLDHREVENADRYGYSNNPYEN